MPPPGHSAMTACPAINNHYCREHLYRPWTKVVSLCEDPTFHPFDFT